MDAASASDKGRQTAELSAKEARAMQHRLESEITVLQNTVSELEHANRCLPSTPAVHCD